MDTIIYKRIAGKNLYSYLDFDFLLNDQGLVFVRGLNVDDGGFLGAGKSSLFEAFSVLQMGKGGKGTKLSDMVNQQVGKDMEASLWLSLNGKDYRISLYQNHFRYGNGTRVVDINTGQNIIPSSSGAHAHTWIRSEKFLNITKDTFFHLVYLAQRMTNVLLTGTDAQRKHQITEMFNLDVYDRLAKNVEQKMKLAETDIRQISSIEEELREIDDILEDSLSIEELKAEHKKYEDQLELDKISLDATIRELRVKEIEIQKSRQRSTYLKELKEIWNSTSSLQEELESYDACDRDYVGTLKEDLGEAQDYYSDLKSSIKRLDQKEILEKQLDRLLEGESAGKTPDLETLNAELTEIKNQLSYLTYTELPQAETRQDILKELIKLDSPDDDVDLDDTREEVKELREEQVTLSSSISMLKAQLDKDVCPTCHRSFDLALTEIADLEETLKTDRLRLKKVTTEIHHLEKVVSTLEKTIGLKARLNDVKTKRKVSDIRDEMTKLTRREHTISASLDNAQRREDIKNQLKSMPKGDANTLRKRLRKQKVLVENLSQKLEAATTIVDRLRRVRSLKKVSRKAVVKEMKKMEKMVTEFTSSISSLLEKAVAAKNQVQLVSDAKAKKVKREKELKKAKIILEEQECYRILKIAFGQKGLKHDRLHAIMREASERTVPRYSDILWPNRQVALELESTESAIRFQLARHGADYSTSSRAISGGESHKAGLAFLFGLRDLKEIYTGKSGNVLILDEPFSHLDPQGKLSLLNVLDVLKSKFSSIFVVSHLTEVVSHPVWDQVWWAIRENNESKLYQSEPPSRYVKMARRYEDGLNVE